MITRLFIESTLLLQKKDFYSHESSNPFIFVFVGSLGFTRNCVILFQQCFVDNLNCVKLFNWCIVGYCENAKMWDAVLIMCWGYCLKLCGTTVIHFFLWSQDDIESNEKFQALQEELIAVKLREAESNLALRELSNHVAELDKDWQVCVDLLTTWYCVVDWGHQASFFNSNFADFFVLHY